MKTIGTLKAQDDFPAPSGIFAKGAARCTESTAALSSAAEPELRARLSGAEIQPLFETGAAFQSYVQRDYARAEELLRIARNIAGNPDHVSITTFKA